MLRSGALWGYVFAIFVASSALGYTSVYKTAAARAGLARAFGSNPGINALIGTAHRIQTAAGFTAWRSLGVLSIVGAFWGLLAGTRLLRGEEEAGRWELLLAGQTTRRLAGGQAIAGLAVGVVTLWTITAVATVAVGYSSTVGISPTAALFFALALASAPTMFLALGACASQLCATRRQATALGGIALGVSYGLRMVADSGAGLQWLRWATPLGWVEELQPLTAPRPIALLPIFGVVLLFTGLSVHWAGARDLGASIIPDRPSASSHTRLLWGSTGLAVRVARPVILGWIGAIATGALIMGFISKSAGEALRSSSSFSRALERLGARGTGAEAYLGFAFLIVAVLLALVVAGQLNGARNEEAEGRLDHLLVRAIPRSKWLSGRVAIPALVVVTGALLAGAFAWVGADSQNARVGFAPLLTAGLSLAPAALFVLGVGTLALAVRPRTTSIVVYGIVAWSFLVELIGGVINANHWLLDTSVFHQLAGAPAVAPDWASAGVLVGLGAAAALLGTWAFERRDLTPA
jgi:ABC-2 type transport system permease protein